MKRILFVLAAVAAIPTAVALAGKTKVNSSSFVKADSYYGRSDGLYQSTTAKGLVAIENGTSAMKIGPAIYEDFTVYGASKGFSCLDWSDGSTCAGDSTTVPQLLQFGDGLRLMSFPIGTATIPPVMTATGLDITGDLTNDEGFEVAGGVLGATGRPFVIGDDPAFYFCATVKITDVSGTDDLQVGFRTLEPFTAAFDDYNNAAAFSVISGTIYIETIDDNAATTSTSTTNTWADAASKKLCVNISGAGVVTYTIDGAAPTTTAAFTWDDGDAVIPFVRVLHDTDVAETTAISKWEVGYTE